MNATTTRTYKINRTSGTSGFLCPPGHYNHTMSLEEYSGPRGRAVQGIYSLDYVDNEHAYASEHLVEAVNRIREESRKTWVASEAWIKSVYGYFRHSYSPDGETRDVSKAITHDPAAIAAGAARKALAEAFSDAEFVSTLPGTAENYRDGSKKPMRAARRGFEVTAKADGSRVYVYALADDGSRYGALPTLEAYAEALTEAGFANVEIQAPQDHPTGFVPERVTADNPVPIERIDPARHLAVMCIREYFPDHTPRLDLIENPGKGYGSWPCTKCGERVQYEAKFDKWAVVTTRIGGDGVTKWTYGTECPKGGAHTVED